MTYRIKTHAIGEQVEQGNNVTQDFLTLDSHEDRLITAIRSHGDPSEALLVATAVIVECLSRATTNRSKA